MTDRSWLVAELGGTNARFAIADPDTRKLTDEAVLPTSSATTLVELVEQYAAASGSLRPTRRVGTASGSPRVLGYAHGQFASARVGDAVGST
jgi:glucokinase